METDAGKQQNNSTNLIPMCGQKSVGLTFTTTKTKGTIIVRYIPSPFDNPIQNDDTSGRWQSD